MNRSLDYPRMIRAGLVVLISALSAWFGHPYLTPDAVNLLVTVFSILAGFLVAVITLIGDPASLTSGSWRRAQLSKEGIVNRLHRHALLFRLYLLSLILIFASMLLGKQFPTALPWLQCAYLFLSVAALLFSFSLPGSLLRIQMKRIDEEIASRRMPEKP